MMRRTSLTRTSRSPGTYRSNRNSNRDRCRAMRSNRHIADQHVPRRPEQAAGSLPVAAAGRWHKPDTGWGRVAAPAAGRVESPDVAERTIEREGFKYLFTRSGPIATGGMDRPRHGRRLDRGRPQALDVLLHLPPWPSASRARINASSRRRELAIIPSAAGPTVTIRSYRYPGTFLTRRTKSGSAAESASRLTISACATALRSQAKPAGRQHTCATLSDGAFRCRGVIRRQATRAASPHTLISSSSTARTHSL